MVQTTRRTPFPWAFRINSDRGQACFFFMMHDLTVVCFHGLSSS